MLELSIKIQGSKEVRAKLRRLGTSLYDLRSPMNEIGNQAARYYANQGMNSQGGVFGAAWTPLKRRTLARKSRTYPGRPPLVATGKMRDSFTFSASSKSVLVGNNAPYFKYHQSTLPRKRLPRRQMMGINAPVKKMVRDIISEEIERKIRAA
jgi:phage gpG-like protein